jgi:phosphatidylglycerophosphate synthase
VLDRYLVPWQERVLHRPAEWLAAQGITANALTIAGFAAGMLAALSLVLQQYNLGLALILVNRVFDGLDGAVARLTAPTDRGAFLDIALDFFFYAAIPVAFALADPAANALPASILLLSFVGTGSSFLAFAAIGERRGIPAPQLPKKGILYLGGLTEGAETIGFLVLACLFPAAFPILALVFAALAMVTTIARWRWGWMALTPPQANEERAIPVSRPLQKEAAATAGRGR